jgi:hypothetical protein
MGHGIEAGVRLRGLATLVDHRDFSKGRSRAAVLVGMRATTAPINISPTTFYADGSGAPTTVECAGYVFACDYLGDVRLTLIKPVSGSRIQNEIAAQRCRRAYVQHVLDNAPKGWLTANEALYTE